MSFSSGPLQRMVSTPQPIPKTRNSTTERNGVTVDVPTCSIQIDLTILQGDALERAVAKLLHVLFPGFAKPHQRVSLERVSGALTNAIYFVSVGRSKLLLRVYGIGCEQLIDRESELRWLSRLSKLNLCPKLLAIFGNGRFEEYLPSTTLTNDDIRDAYLSPKLAARFRQLHSIVHLYPFTGSYNKLCVWQNVDRWYSSLRSLALSYPFDLESLGQEIEIAKSILRTVASPVVFGHNDAQYGNVLRLNGTDDLVLVDFEYAGYNPEGLTDTPEDQLRHQFPTIDEQRRFLAAYAAEHTEDVDTLLQETSAWIMAVHLHWALWGFMQASQSEIDFDYHRYALQHLGAFHRKLKEYTS
ncbi:kinase-like domain-containing protein [Fennellomyces sp. T-0311]|nr:kinase-like domain-containing protein [Fennellomyces sp. T-0311]